MPRTPISLISTDAITRAGMVSQLRPRQRGPPRHGDPRRRGRRG